MNFPTFDNLAAANEKVKELWIESRYDQLTELPNRRLAKEIGHDLVCSYTVLFMDLNGFKKVNDTAGHDAGDKVLQLVAHQFRLENGDKVFRWAGDEFFAILPGNIDVNTVIASIKDRLSSLDLDNVLPSSMAGHKCGVAIGYAHSSEEKNFLELVDLADSRMYEDKG